MNARLRAAFSPVPEVGRRDTSLRYTDILFGFVIRELFIRLQNLPALRGVVIGHLVVGTTLVLGSWIGYRRSRNRTAYEVKFFNLPFFKFLVDQIMLILYFRIATLTPANVADPPSDLTTHTLRLLVYIFGLYILWDALGTWMVKASTRDASGTPKPKYPVVVEDEKTLQPKMSDKRDKVDMPGVLITVGFSLAIVVAWAKADAVPALTILAITTGLLLLYRWAKDYRTSWRSLQPAV